MEILHSEVVPVHGAPPDYNQNNPVARLLTLVKSTSLAASREKYPLDALQYLFPIRALQLYGPSPPEDGVLDPKWQDNKLDFQKQNVASFQAADTQLIRGIASTGVWRGPFLRLSYRAGPDSVLAGMAHASLGPTIRLWLRVGRNATPTPLSVPHDAETGRYAIELWSWPGTPAELRAALDPRGQAAFDRGALIAAPSLVPGKAEDFLRETLDEKIVYDVAPDHALHPTRSLHIEAAWATADGSVWDSLGGANYQFEFSMVLRGRDNYLRVGITPNPHGGLPNLEYRNLLTHYYDYTGGKKELARDLPPWSLDAFHRRPEAPGVRREEFMAVEYMDLHVLRPNAAIGLHRHRDNQEVFMVLGGHAGLMVVGDWAKMPNRERSLEVRTLKPGHLALLKGGNLHGLINPSDEDMILFMFGGYD
jgi:mannose-6-phosphate isomerase-like protein (cupin superfamily)